MCWDENSGSWCEWDKIGRIRRFGYFGGGELETTDLGSGIGVHSLVYPPLLWFSEPRCWGLLTLGGHELTPV
jgi:hypothetical protein